MTITHTRTAPPRPATLADYSTPTLGAILEQTVKARRGQPCHLPITPIVQAAIHATVTDELHQRAAAEDTLIDLCAASVHAERLCLVCNPTRGQR